MEDKSIREAAQEKVVLAEQKIFEFPENLKSAMRLADVFSDIEAEEYVLPFTRKRESESRKAAALTPSLGLEFTRL